MNNEEICKELYENNERLSNTLFKQVYNVHFEFRMLKLEMQSAIQRMDSAITLMDELINKELLK